MQLAEVMSGTALQNMCTSFKIKLTGNQPGCGWQLADTGRVELWKLSTSKVNTAQWTWTATSTSPLSEIHYWMQSKLTWLYLTIAFILTYSDFLPHEVTSHLHYDVIPQPLVCTYTPSCLYSISFSWRRPMQLKQSDLRIYVIPCYVQYSRSTYVYTPFAIHLSCHPTQAFTLKSIMDQCHLVLANMVCLLVCALSSLVGAEGWLQYTVCMLHMHMFVYYVQPICMHVYITGGSNNSDTVVDKRTASIVTVKWSHLHVKWSEWLCCSSWSASCSERVNMGRPVAVQCPCQARMDSPRNST